MGGDNIGTVLSYTNTHDLIGPGDIRAQGIGDSICAVVQLSIGELFSGFGHGQRWIIWVPTRGPFKNFLKILNSPLMGCSLPRDGCVAVS